MRTATRSQPRRDTKYSRTASTSCGSRFSFKCGTDATAHARAGPSPLRSKAARRGARPSAPSAARDAA
eukprot:6497624-Pyramimonas_sp.AAC.1